MASTMRGCSVFVRLLSVLLLAGRSSIVSVTADTPKSPLFARVPVVHNDSTLRDAWTEALQGWKALVFMDPGQLVPHLLRFGEGLFLSDEMKHDIEILRDLVRIEKAELNPIDKHMVLHNFSIGIVDKPDALRVEKVHIRWDSYTQPCLEILVENVSALVQFTNIILTQSNWNDILRQSIFFDKDGRNHTMGNGILPLLRLKSIDFSGMFSVRVSSTPFAKDLAEMTLDLSATQELSTMIRDSAKNATSKYNRCGLSTDEIVAILKDYLGKQVRTVAVAGILDAINDPSCTIRKAREAGKIVVNYAGDAGVKTKEHIQGLVETKVHQVLGDAGTATVTKARRVGKVLIDYAEDAGAKTRNYVETRFDHIINHQGKTMERVLKRAMDLINLVNGTSSSEDFTEQASADKSGAV